MRRTVTRRRPTSNSTRQAQRKRVRAQRVLLSNLLLPLLIIVHIRQALHHDSWSAGIYPRPSLAQTCPLSALKDTPPRHRPLLLPQAAPLIPFHIRTARGCIRRRTYRPHLSHRKMTSELWEKARVKPCIHSQRHSAQQTTASILIRRPRVKQRHRAWEDLRERPGRRDPLSALRSNSMHHPDLYRAILRAFRHRNIEFLVAPYLASGQLVSMERHAKDYIHSIYAPTENLLFTIESRDSSPSLNLSEYNFQYVSKQAILTRTQVQRGAVPRRRTAGRKRPLRHLPRSAGLELRAPPPHAGAPPNLRQINDLVKQYKADTRS